ncbi:UDP-N-acetylmuramoyl-L-alanyl-D-glutamate--2,6-diaminopimelate ligase [Herbiconiux sp. CPCC 203407]|uniref:UDP-N-acetylmuramyl-tripeptide synthetase n=1 Tax=Herbiconiux oxytropis TaxID=2970915 RepID=A0AA41XJK5_9MICO|nr:UDP-N-acetylmuramoyl-L-alanyl-D-glutamate--2,6-diaminopimelate ligase [Herbiconiux oxytropis]MCS5722810.1 UDP-N-acetylmuramoyl-L-alanyl-D-glutamate--2,6-diaminopimelate ligase [Herbiconiux oxytropis]MCS5727740.1 UDP-N-acetylmuramoyl-L-alanyl-D-glutamate--2,6-diaminopimelate ligase [Herbiconiux oxytropis]
MADRGSSALRPEHPIARSLPHLVEEFGFAHRGAPVADVVSGITLSSKDVVPGDLYVGLKGARFHGASFAAAARDAGAVAVLTDDEGAEIALDSGLPIIVTPDPRLALGEVAAWIHRTREDPPTMFGVTGTNGKTSVAYLLEAILRQLGIVAGLSTTAERRIGDETIVAKLTTPEATEIHAMLARMREADVRSVVLEVSAQAITQHRVDGIVFDVVGFTNLSHDHLDDYETMDVYFAAKRELFQPDRAKRGVVIVDGGWGTRLVEESRIPLTTIGTSATAEGIDTEWNLVIDEETLDRTTFTLRGPDHRELTTSVPLVGSYMAANAALAIVMLVESGFDLDAIAHALNEPYDGDDRDLDLERTPGIDVYIPGRTEKVSGDRGPIVYIDYGHTPDAFVSALEALRRVAEGRIVMVFGADGDRDPSKREDMGAIAARLADAVVVTDFHPRYEDAASIRRVLVDAAKAAVPEREVHEVPDPRAAFRHALTIAGEGDVILYAGPGHEDYHEVAGERIPYSARDDARNALHEHGWL